MNARRQGIDFFQAQDAARSRSRTLVLLFVAAVAAIIAVVYGVVHVAMGPGPRAPIDPTLLVVVALLVTLLVSVGSTARTLQLRQGGSKVAEMLGGRRVRASTTDEAERRLVNVVEEMAIASGTPVPAIYVLDNEPGINAFAAGYTLDDAAVAVTRGTLQQLDREELQGVIAHEFSHILNGDMRLNIRLIGLLFGILLLAIIGRGLLYAGRGGGRRRDGGAGQVALVGIALVVVGYVGVFFGRLIQSAVSRQREYLADAAAVQFTRNPDGIAGALKKIGGVGSRLQTHHAQEASHLFFASGLRSGLAGMFATHPPLDDRIRRIDPAFDGTFPAPRPVPRELHGGGDARVAGFGGYAAAPAATTAESMLPADWEMPERAARGDALVASVGAPQPEHVAYASRLLRALPDAVYAAAHDPDSAAALLLALLLHDHGPGAARQQELLDALGGLRLRQHAVELSRAVTPLGPAARLPLLDLLLPALRELTPAQALRVRETVEAMIAADGRMDAFELALLHVIDRQLEAARTGRAAHRDGNRSLEGLRDEAVSVLAVIAWSGARSERTAQEAFAAGVHLLPDAARGAALPPRAGASIATIETALDRLRSASHAARRQFLAACAATVSHDGLVEVAEAEILRAIGEALECPIPPLVG